MIKQFIRTNRINMNKICGANVDFFYILVEFFFDGSVWFFWSGIFIVTYTDTSY